MTVVDVIGGGLGGCCQVTVIASLSSCATAPTLEGHEGTPTSDVRGMVNKVLSRSKVCIYVQSGM